MLFKVLIYASDAKFLLLIAYSSLVKFALLAYNYFVYFGCSSLDNLLKLFIVYYNFF